MEQLTQKQAAFVKEYIKDFNGLRSAIAAGYSPKSARAQACENLTKPNIQKNIAKEVEARCKRLEFDADRVLQRLIQIDKMDIRDIFNDDWTIKPLNEWPDIWCERLTVVDIKEFSEGNGDAHKRTALLKKLRWPDKLKNLEMIGRHVNVQAWRDKVQSDNLHTVVLHDPSAGTKVEQY